jgi:hypothetical protein
VPILRIDNVSIKGKLLGVWQALYSGGVLDFKEITAAWLRLPITFRSRTYDMKASLPRKRLAPVTF